MDKFEEIIKNPDQVAMLTSKDEEELLQKTERILEQEPNLIPLSGSGCAIFIGDTHGDFDATKEVTTRYLKDDNKLVFLGDYVDRGSQSRENIDYLALLKLNYPDDVFLLMGNHETYDVMNFYPADFWEKLDSHSYLRYTATLSKLPLAVSTENGILALHGALPNMEKLSDINKIKLGSEEWQQTVWGDFQNRGGRLLGNYGGRPQFGEDYFSHIMAKFNKNLLIRSHQPMTPILYDKRCLTIFTSQAYFPLRTVAIVDLEKEIKTSDDLTIETI